MRPSYHEVADACEKVETYGLRGGLGLLDHLLSLRLDYLLPLVQRYARIERIAHDELPYHWIFTFAQ